MEFEQKLLASAHFRAVRVPPFFFWTTRVQKINQKKFRIHSYIPVIVFG